MPALLVSTAAGLVVTRSSGDMNFGQAITLQIFGQRKALDIAAGALGHLGLVPGLPTLPFLLLAAVAPSAPAAFSAASRGARTSAQDAEDLAQRRRPLPPTRRRQGSRVARTSSSSTAWNWRSATA